MTRSVGCGWRWLRRDDGGTGERRSPVRHRRANTEPAGVILIILLAGALASLNGCAAGAMGVSEARDQNARRALRDRIQVENAARVNERLLPLDLCSQSYWTNRRWALKDRTCAARVRRYEFGDSTALDPANMALPATVPAVSDSVQGIYDERARAYEFKYGGSGNAHPHPDRDR
jgi:hypothetical protein